MPTMLHEFANNVLHNLFKPLLLFFYMGFAVPIFRVAFEFPYVIYQGLTIYLLIAIGWHGGEELAHIWQNDPAILSQALGFMFVGFFTNFIIGILAYFILRSFTRLRRVDAATVAGYYGSDSAGTFVTCVGVLTAAGISFAAYMPVMLAVMEIPGCLVALYLVSRLRQKGMDAQGNAWDEPGYERAPVAMTESMVHYTGGHGGHGESSGGRSSNGLPASAVRRKMAQAAAPVQIDIAEGGEHVSRAVEEEAEMALERIEGQPVTEGHAKSYSVFSAELLHEVFLNPGLFLLFGGILIGFISQLQGQSVVAPDDELFVKLFQGMLCLFLLEMGMTASKRLRDLKAGGWQFVAFGLIGPNIFATLGIFVAHGYSLAIGQPLQIGTYVLFSVLCAAASYIAVPAVQRLAIPEASPTLPLAASLGLTFSYNVTIGIPVYIEIAKLVKEIGAS